LIILSLIDSNLNKFQKSLFFLIFSASLIISHYGLSYLFMLMLVLAWAISIVGESKSFRKYNAQFLTWFQKKTGFHNEINPQKNSFQSKSIPFIFVLWYGVFLSVWYIYTAGSSAFDSIVRIGFHITTSISSEFLNPKAAQGIALITAETVTPLHEVAKYIYLLSIFFIVIGFIISIVKYLRVKFDLRYLLFSFGALIICFGGVVLPYFASALNTSRVFQISLILLAPFCVLGGVAILRLISGFIKISWTNQRFKNSLQILSVFFAIFLLFNSGWVYEVSNDHPFALLNSTIDYTKFNEQESSGAKWLNNIKDEKLIYADEYRWWLLARFYPQQNIGHLPKNDDKIPEESYVFLGNFNIINKRVVLENIETSINMMENSDSSSIFTNRSRIYDDGGAEIYYR
jgi:uncharacterized membrane protein